MSNITNGALALTADQYKVSNSEIQTFQECRRKWWLSYYRRLKPRQERITGPLALGSRVHEALDVHYSTGKDLLEAYNDILAEEKYQAEIRGIWADDVNSEGELGRIMLEGYLQWSAEEGIDADLDMISTEEIISMPLLDGKVILQGKLDMRVRRKSDGVRMFRDFKTVGTTFDQYMRTAHLNEQILTYMLLEQYQNKNPEERSEGGIFTLLRKVKRSANAKPPFYAQHEVGHNVFDLRSFWLALHGVLNDLMSVKDTLDQGGDPRQYAYRHVTNDCTWKCQFFSICGMFDDGSPVEEAIAEHFEVHNPYDYYLSSDEKKGSE